MSMVYFVRGLFLRHFARSERILAFTGGAFGSKQSWQG
jgi:hypothetical protein